MSGLTELGQILHEQHFRILVLVSGLENRVRGDAGTRPIDINDESDRALLEELAASLTGAIEHNAFEEKVLFPLLCRHGEGELATLLTQEHVVIGPIVRRVQMLAGELLMNGSDPARWPEFRDAAQRLVGEMLTHLQKEEMAVVQRLGFFLDAETDHRLAHALDGDAETLELQAVAVPAVEPMPISAAAIAAVSGGPTTGGLPPLPRTMRRTPAATAAGVAARRRSTAPRHP
jgi:hemerythrin-like domain-containing protein